MSGKSFQVGNLRFLKKGSVYEYFNVFRNVRWDIFDLYTFIMSICWYINCLLYIYSLI